MTRRFQIKTVPSNLLDKAGRRLDCGPYMSGVLEAREKLARLPNESLSRVTKGIFHAGRESRLWVESPEYGIPFLGSTDILAADLTHLPFLAKRQVQSNPSFILHEGYTLITRSGTIGRMAYCRSDMDGLACSEHAMRVIPDSEAIRPGYLYAYLSGRFGVPLVVSGTYGSIIQSIEPEHIADLPVPRLGDVEQQAHDLVTEAASLRVDANRCISQLVADLEAVMAGGPHTWCHRKPQSFSIETRSASDLNRLDAFHYIGFAGEAEGKVTVPLVPISGVAEVLRPPIFKRVRVEEGGYEFLGGADVMTLGQQSSDRISANTRDIEKYIVKPGQVLFQCVGQRYGIFGRPTLANRNLIGKAVSEHQIRITPHDPRDAGYIFVFLATQFGLRFLLKNSSGTSIPVLLEEQARKTLIYWPDEELRRTISTSADQAWEQRAQAVELESEARTLVERAIEQGGA